MPAPRRIASTSQAITRLGSFGPITRSAAFSHGLTEGQVRAALAAGSLVTVQPGTLLPRQIWLESDESGRHFLALESALLRHPSAIASHRSAALLLQLPWNDSPVGTYLDSQLGRVPIVEITQPGVGRRQPRLRMYSGIVPDDQRAHLIGMPVTSVGRTVLDSPCNCGHHRPSPSLTSDCAGSSLRPIAASTCVKQRNRQWRAPPLLLISPRFWAR